MAKPRAADRLDQIADAALRAFTESGFRLTQVEQVARLAGVAKGTIYLYADGKVALFWLALRRAMNAELVADGGASLSARDLRSELALRDGGLNLRDRLRSGEPLPSLESVVREHWTAVSRGATAIKLVERCAADWPELAREFYGGLRADVVATLADYLVAGAEQGVCRRVPDPLMAARLIVETIAWFAMHRLGDPDGRFMDPDAARETTVDALTHAFAPLVPPENPL